MNQVAVNAALRTKINTPPKIEPDYHRFTPTEKPRSVNSSPEIKAQKKLAGEVNFEPVATVSVSSGDTYVRPVNNTQNRPLSASVVNKNGQVSIRGEKVIGLEPSLHEQIQAKVNQNASYEKETLVAPEKVAPIPVVKPVEAPKGPPLTPEQDKVRNQELKNQLEEINKVLFEQIRTKISTELARQQQQPIKPPSDEIKTPAFKQPRNPIPVEPELKPAVAVNPKIAIAPAPIVEQPKPVLAPNPTPSPAVHDLEPKKPVTSQPVIKVEPQNPPVKPEPVIENKPLPQIKPSVAAPVAAAETTVNKVKPQAQLATAELKSHIESLEKEIEVLTKEISHIDQTISSLERDRSEKDLVALEQKLDNDEKMMNAVVDWRYSLTNLVNSHSVALKYLKQRTDWLQDKVETLDGHRTRHDKTHRKPKSVEITLEKLPVADSNPKPAANEVPTTTKISVSTGTMEDSNQIIQSSVDAATKVESPKEDKVAVSEVRDLIESALNKQKEEFKKTLADQKQTSEAAPTKVEVHVTPAQTETRLAEPGKPGATPTTQTSLPPTEKKIEAPVPKIELPTNMMGDIERQILEAAKHEESVKEKQFEETQKLIAQKKQEQEAKNKPVPEETLNIPSEQLKADLAKLGSEIAVNAPNLRDLKPEERSAMISKLKSLENETEVTRQFDELKAVAERKRINEELKAMMDKVNPPKAEPAPTPAPEVSQGAAPTTIERIENLKEQQKVEKTPEQKAKIIAEIKDLERIRESKKLEARSRPVVKAQPAYGKMLPNTPTIPNVINGIVKDNKGLLMDTVVIIVKDHNGDPVRAFKTNKIGQFAVSTPLPNGIYTLELEKANYEFDIIEVEVNGAILPPIEVKAR